MVIRLSLTASLMWALLATNGYAQPEPQTPAATATGPSQGSHGGSMHQAGDLQFEVIVEPGALRLFAYNRQGQPLDLQAARGLATLHIQGEPKRYRYDLFPEVRKDQSAQSLAVAVDLRRFAGQEAELTLQLVGLPGSGRRPLTVATTTTVPMTEAQRVAAAISAQKTCPVSGQPLGSMGQPIPVTIGEETVYVCCAGCIDAVKANPAKYLAKNQPLTVAPATEADAKAIALQKLCPVMDEPLDAMGGPFKTDVRGRVVYLCCPGCAKKLHAEPQVYLTKLASQGVTPPAAR